jgi:phage-related protein (TIGR01555 family)
MTRRARTWGRLYGGGALYLGLDDGRMPWEPVDLAALRRVLWVTDVDRRDLYPLSWDSDPLSAHFGLPLTYRLTRMGGTATESVTVHASRIVRFEGSTPTRRRRLVLQGWGDSVLQRVFAELQQARAAFAGAGVLIQESSQGVLKIKGLAEAMAQDGDDDVFRKRLDLMDRARSLVRSLLLDADGESYERVEVGTLSGIVEILDRNINLLAAVSETPVTVLMGQAPAGLNATGDSDVRNWYDQVQSEREHQLRPQLTRVLDLILRSSEGPTRGQPVEGARIVFPSLWQPSPTEQADLRSKQADVDSTYIQTGVLTPAEVALSRFRREGWSDDTSIDLASRRAPADALTEGSPTQGAAPPADVQATALNGAQTASLVTIVQAVAARTMSRASGLELIKISTPTVPDDSAERALGPADFVPASPGGSPTVTSSDAAAAPQTSGLTANQHDLVARIGDRVAERKISRATGVAQLAEFLGVDTARAERLLGDEHYTAPELSHAAEMDRLRGEHAAALRSQQSAKAMLRGVLERNRNGELVKGNPILRAAAGLEPEDPTEPPAEPGNTND